MTVKEGYGYGLTGLRELIKEDLCTGETIGTVQVTVVAPAELAGAKLTLDGKPSWMLSLDSSPGLTIVVESGPHEFRFEKVGYKPIVKRVTYTADEREAEMRLESPIPAR